MKRLIFLVALLMTLVLVANCSREKPELPTGPGAQLDKGDVVPFERNPAPGEVPDPTVEILPVTEFVTTAPSTTSEASLTPALLTATLRPGECITESKMLHLPADVAPALGDIMFVMDLTGSMSGELSNVRMNSINIMNAIRGIIPATRFGLISHMDYVGEFSGCDYWDTYGGGPDYPYSLDQGLTGDLLSVQSAINGLSLGYGYDGPENYSRALYESYADPGVGWLPGSTKFVIAWGDAVPHDCAYDACTGGSSTSGPDPGRDEVVGTADDLEILNVLDGMNAAGATLISLFSGGGFNLPLWDCYASRTGPDGAAFQINSDGTIPGGVDIASYIAGLIQAAISHIDELTLAVCDPMYADWLVSVEPASYTDIDLDVPQDFPFEINICVPEGTPDGEYCFDVCALGDGNEYARQTVCITVRSEVEIPLDVHPTSCPNPINVASQGVTPVAILGTADFDVSEIDPETVLLEGVAPLRWAISDVATPFMPYIGRESCSDCSTERADGFYDLNFKFPTPQLVAAFGRVEGKDCIVVRITGQLYDGTAFVGEDVVKIPSIPQSIFNGR